MSDHTAGGSGHHAHRAPRVEFYAYFTLIFLVAIPVAVVTWTVQLVLERHLPTHGPLARAWRQAGSITPNIFRP
jgi:hypothetical protein